MTASIPRPAWLLLLAAGLVALAGCGHRTHDDVPAAGRAAAAPPVPVTVAPVSTRRVERTVEVVGTLEGYEEVNVAAKVDGRVLRIYHDIGDEVAPGEPLADLEDVDWQLAVAEARAASSWSWPGSASP
ncbi:MAG: biotin/lipoyl-binding protein [Gemmataceae bacterium]